MKTIITITKIQLLSILLGINKPTFFGMVTMTPVRMIKTGNPYFGKVFKVKRGNFLTGTDYESRVQDNEIKETSDFPTFLASENKVGHHVSKSVLYNSKTKKHYFQHERFDNSILETVYLFEGRQINKFAFQEFMPDSNTYENQPIKNKVKTLSVTVDNIKTLAIDKKIYVVVG